MEWVVTSGESIEEATEAALDELGIDLDEAEIEVLEEPRAGLFGIHKRDARVRARVAPTTPRPKAERRDRRRRSSEGRGGGRKGAGSGSGKDEAGPDEAGTSADAEETAEVEAPKAKPAKAKSVKAKSAKARSAKADAGDGSEVADASGDGDGEPTPAPRKRTRKRPAAKADAGDGSEVADASGDGDGEPTPAPRKRTRKRPAAKAASPAEDVPSDGDDTEHTEQGASMTSISIEDQVEVIEDFLDGLMEAFDLDGEISTVEIDDETSEVRIEGEELGYLIGPKGQTLAAVHELCRTVAQRRLAGPHEGRIRLDIGGYRERRREALARFATQVAEDVRSSGVEKALEPMSPPDRKVVHDTINEIDGVSTSSEGEEPRRRVVVSPVD